MIKINDILEGTISSNLNGSAYLVCDESKKDIYINKNKTNKALHLDKVKVKIIQGTGRALEGQVIEIIERFKTDFVGVIKISERYAFFIPDNNKISVDFFIPINKTMGAINGQKVVARLTKWKDDSKNPDGEIVKILGNAGEHETEIHAILQEYNLPYDFPEEVLIESETISEEISQSEIDKRRDMRDVLTFTIDPHDAKDYDDALSVRWVDGVLEVGVHIADVSHYLISETDLDKEAYMRGTSVYLVDRCVPMLPEKLSNGLCSLRPHEDKLCFSAVFKMDQNGHVLEEWFGKTVIHSDHRFTYEEAQEIIEWKDYNAMTNLFKKIGLVDFSIDEKVDEDLVKATKLGNAILNLDKYAKKMRKARFNKGSISFDKHEVKFKLDENNKPIDVIFKVGKDSNKLIEEYMLLANRRVAEYINQKGLPMVNRTHDKPDEARLQSLKDFIQQFGYKINIDTPEDTTRSLNNLLLNIRGTSEEDMISNLVIRTMQKANYMTKNIGHYGLGFKDYSHFTSPIRRYPDVIVHRLLESYLNKSTKLNSSLPILDAKCLHLSEREKKAQKAERDSIKYMQCVYMSDRIGKVYKGLITSVTDYGVFVEITENKCDCLVKLSNIPGTWVTDLSKYCIKEYNTGETIRLGDEVMVVISKVDIEKKNIDATLIRL